MSYISECAGGFAFIGRDGKLYIRTIYQDEQEIPLSLFGEYKWGDKCSISKVSYENGVESFKFGDDTGNNLWLNQENMYIVDENEVENIYNQLKGLEAYSFEGKTIIDPALDVGDKIIIDDKPVVYQGEADFQTRFIAQINSKIAIKQKQETTVKTISQKVLNRRVQSRIDEAEGKITQLVEENSEFENKLTKVEQDVNGIKETVSSVEKTVQEANKNANEAKETVTITTEKVTKVEKTVDGITESVKKVETNLGENYSTTEEMNSAINQSAGNITSSVTEKIENVQVGGTNLIPNSAPYDKSNYVVSDINNIELTLQDEESSPYKKCLRIRTLKQLEGTAGIYIYMTQDKLQAGKEYCFSLWLKATANTTLSVGYSSGGNTNFNVTTSWKKFTHKFIAAETSDSKKGFAIYLPINVVAGRQVFIHSIKLEEGNKVTAWSPAPNDDVKGFEFGTKIEQNSKYVQYAWNNESQNIKLEQDNGNSTMGFYDSDTKFAEMGVNNVDDDRYISFAIPCDYGQNIADGMAWGIQTPDGKFWPILYVKDFHMANKNAGDFSGNLVLSACNLLLEGINSAITCGNVNISSADALGGIMFEDAITHKNLLTIMPKTVLDDETINILDKIMLFRNQAGSVSFKIGTEDRSCLLTDEGTFSCYSIYVLNDISCNDLHVRNNLSCIGNIEALSHIYCNNGVEPFSLAEKKRNIEKYNNSALNEILNTDIYYYNYKEDNENTKKRVGAVIGEDYRCSKEIIGTEHKGIDLYSMMSVAYKAIQEQQEMIENLEKANKRQEETIKDLTTRVKELEKGASQ